MSAVLDTLPGHAYRLAMKINRRTFIQTAAASAVAIPAATAATVTAAQVPGFTPNKTPLKLGLMTYMVGASWDIPTIIKNLKDGEITVSLFIDPDLDQVRAAHKVDADRIELHTGRYCEARNERERARELSRIVDAAKAAAKLGMSVAAGHGLNYDNVQPIARIREIDELNIGHSIVGRAVLVGFERAVREMLELMRNPG